MSQVSDQLRGGSLGESALVAGGTQSFHLSAQHNHSLATPLYFFVVPVTVRLTAPWWTRP